MKGTPQGESVPSNAVLASSVNKAALATLAALPIAQLATGASLEYAALSALFNVLTVVAVRACGGLYSVCGGIIALIALKSLILGHLVKAATWNPPEVGLVTPLTTIGVLTSGMGMAALGCVVARLFVPPLQALRPVLSPRRLERIWIFALVMCVPKYFGEAIGLPDIVAKALTYFSYVDALAVSAATARCLIMNGGRRPFDLRVALTVGLLFVNAFNGGSKQGMLEAVFTWAVTATSFGFVLRRSAILPAVAFALLFHFVVYPVAQSRAMFRDESAFSRLKKAAVLADRSKNDGSLGLDFDPNDIDIYKLISFRTEHDISEAYLGFEPLFLQRLVQTPIGDRLVSSVESIGPLTYEVASTMFTLIPREISGFGAQGNLSNVLGKRSGILGDTDDVTGVSFGPFVENFAVEPGVEGHLITAIGTFFLAAVAFVFGHRLRNSIWSVTILLMFQHVASESSSLLLQVIMSRSLPTLVLIYFWLARPRRAEIAHSDQLLRTQVPALAARSQE